MKWQEWNHQWNWCSMLKEDRGRGKNRGNGYNSFISLSTLSRWCSRLYGCPEDTMMIQWHTWTVCVKNSLGQSALYKKSFFKQKGGFQMDPQKKQELQWHCWFPCLSRNYMGQKYPEAVGFSVPLCHFFSFSPLPVVLPFTLLLRASLHWSVHLRL